MVRPVHSKRKLFNNAKEHKENTTPDEHLEELPRLDETQQGESNKSLHCQLSQQFCPQDNKTHLNRPLPVISTSSETSSKTSNKTSKQNFAGKSTRPWVEDEEASCAAVGGTPARPRHAMPMSERQQIALLLQMSSPSSTKFIPESSSPSPRCYSPYCDPSDPGTPQSSGMLAGGVATPSGGGRGAATPSAGGGRGTATPSAGGGRAAGVGKRNERGETPLHVAAIRGDVERVQQLIARGSDVNAVDYAGWTALHEACNRGFVSVAVELINAGASVNAKGLDNETPLHDACVNNHLKLVELLLESGASTSIVNRRGQTPADVCRSPVILALLQQSARDTSEVLGLEMSRRTPPSSAVKGPDALKVEIKEEEEQCDEVGDRSEGSSTSTPQVSSASTSTSSSSSSCSGGRPSSPRVALRITSTGQAKTPDKRNSTDSKSTEGRASSDDPYEFKCTKDETPSSGNKDEEEEESSSKPHTPGKNDSAGEERGEKRSIDDDEDETARKRKRKEEVKDQLPVTPSKNAGKGEKTSKPSSRSCSSNSGPNYTANSGKNSSILGATSGGALAAVDPPTSQDTNRKSPQTSSSSPKSSIKQEKCDEAADEENCSRSDAPNSTNSSSSTGSSSNGNINNSSPKVPPLKIVLSSCGNNSNNNNSNSGINSTTGGSGSSGGIDQESAGQQSGNGGNKNGNGNGGSSGRHLPYVVSSSSNAGQDHINIKEENNSSAHASNSTASNNSTHDSKDNLSPLVKEEPLSPGGCEKSATRITRSTRSNTDEAGSAASLKLEVKVEEAAVTSISSSPATLSSATTTPLTATTSVSASSSSTSNNSAPVASSSSTTEVVHPRKRKINIKEEDSDPPPPPSVPELPLSNCYQMFLVIRKQIDDRRKLLFPVQPIPPQGFKDYLMNRATYVLAGNPASQQSVPLMTPPASLPQPLKDLFTEQERARHKLRLLHQIEREKMALCVEQEILRVHGRRAAALANQMLPFSACNILRDQEVYNVLTPEQEEKHRNARSRFNGRLFNSWLQDVDDKWEKIRESMVLRQQNEAESLHAVHRMDWEWKMKEVGLCDNKSNPVIDDLHVPMVAVSDFDHLSA